ILLPRRPAEPLEEALDPPRTVPADDARGDLVPDCPGEERRVPRALGDAGADPPCDRSGAAPLVEEGDVLLPREAGQHAEPVSRRAVEEPERRRGVRPDRVRAERR